MDGETAKLESEVAVLTGRTGGVATDSGTSALLLALHALALRRPLRRVAIPAYACRSLLFAVRAAGAEPLFIDTASDLRLDPNKAIEAGKRADAIVLVHPFGMIEPLVTEQWPCPVIEDIAQSAGAELSATPVGNFGTLTVASFYATKPWGGAMGGMVLGDDMQLLDRVREMRLVDGADGNLPYAGNHQLSDLHAALARVRLTLAADEMAARRRHAATIYGWFGGLRSQPVAGFDHGNHFRLILRTDDAANAVFALNRQGIGATRPVDRTLAALVGNNSCPNAEAWQRHALSLPLPADLSASELAGMCAAVRECLP